MDDLLLHPVTRRQLEQVLSGSHHGLALIGPAGAGKGHIADALAGSLLGTTTDHSLYRAPGEQSAIGIEAIRAIQSFLRLKSVGTKAIRRVIIIEDAHLMTLEAQNALLKILEEPPTDTKLILTVSGAESLRPTIYSRVQQVHIKPCPLDTALGYFLAKGHAEADIRKAYLISGGYIGLCNALLTDTEHRLVQAISLAKEFVSKPMYERLLDVDMLAKDKENIALFLFALKRILTAAARQKAQPALLERLRSVHAAEAALGTNPNLKLLLSDVALHL